MSVEAFEEHRSLLNSVAYRMLGSVADAEDVVQEAWLRWSQADRSEIDDPRGYLVRVTTTAAIDHLRKAQRRREAYIGPWLPEPLLTGPDVAETAALAESVSMAMLVVMETLSPLERAVFVLREAFGFSFGEIAAALGRSEQATRQVAHRAREHVQARRPRFQADRTVRRELTERFLAAAIGGDVSALLRVLDPEVTLWADGGGKVKAPRRPIYGAERVARFFAGVAGDVPPDAEIRIVDLNGGPAAVIDSGGHPIAVLVIDADPDSDLVGLIRLIGNPEKLAVLERSQI